MSDPTIPFDAPESVPCAVLLFNLRNASTANDAEIERLSQECIKFLMHRAEKRKLSIQEVICASQEMMARLLIAPVMCGAQDRAAAERLIADMMGIATQRALALLDANAPGTEPQPN